jgi:hypothetical protein
MTQEELIRLEVEKQLGGQQERNPLHNELLSLGGGVVGSGLGLLAINPTEYISERRNIKHNNRMVDGMENEQNALRALRDIHEGKATFEEYGKSEPVLREMYTANKELLDDPQVLNRFLDNPLPGRVERMSRIPLSGSIDPTELARLKEHKRRIAIEDFKRALPNRNIIDNFAEAVKHPAVSLGGLAGMAGGYYLADHLEKKNRSQS